MGWVPTVDEWYERYHAVVVPMFEGSGTRLKIVEAMAYGRLVVFTPLGVQGLPVTAGTHYHCADDAPAFVWMLAEAATDCEHDGGPMTSMLDEARQAISPLFWRVSPNGCRSYTGRRSRYRMRKEPARRR